MEKFVQTKMQMLQATVETQQSCTNNPKKRKITDESFEPDKYRPKRVRSAYNFFFQSERAKMLGLAVFDGKTSVANGKRKHIKTHGKIGFTDLVREISMKWNNLDARSKSRFYLMYEADKKRYNKEIKDYDLKLTESVKHRFETNREREKEDDHVDTGKKQLEINQKSTGTSDVKSIAIVVVASQLDSNTWKNRNMYFKSSPTNVDTKSSKDSYYAGNHAKKSFLGDFCLSKQKPVFDKSNRQKLRALTDAELELRAVLGDEVIGYLRNMEI